MKPSPLHLEGYFVKELAVEVNPSFEKRQAITAWMGYHYQPDDLFEPDVVTFDASGFYASKKDDPLRRVCALTIVSDRKPRKKVPYFFRITLEGYFQICPSYPTERIEILFHANAPGLLYGAAREILASITGRGPFPAIVLPSISFLDDAEKIAAEINEQKAITTAKRIKRLPAKSRKGTKKTSKKR
jgi:preprotein translocase subunit SecB